MLISPKVVQHATDFNIHFIFHIYQRLPDETGISLKPLKKYFPAHPECLKATTESKEVFWPRFHRSVLITEDKDHKPQSGTPVSHTRGTGLLTETYTDSPESVCVCQFS